MPMSGRHIMPCQPGYAAPASYTDTMQCC